MSVRVLLLGGSGQIGRELRSALAGFADVAAPTHAELDGTRLDEVEAFATALAPAWIVNAAAYTRVDDAERERAAAELLNAALPERLAEVCERTGGRLLHFSTDYVFSGTKTTPYVENDETRPVNWYGATKLAGERRILGITDRALIFRTSWIYARTGQNFFRTMLRLAREREELRVVSDQRGSPTWARAVAEAAAQVVERVERGTLEGAAARGIFHLTASGETSWHEFAIRLLALDPQRAEHRVRRITPIPSTDYVTPAVRPSYSVLDCTLAEERLGIRLPSWERQLEMAWASA